MTWKTLRDALEMAAACGFDVDVDGEGSVAAEPRRRRKGPEPVKAPASSREGGPCPVTNDRPVLRNGKREPAHDPTSAPPLGAGSRLLFRVIEGGGGRREEGGPCVRRLRVSPRRKASELGWVVHSAASRTCVCEAAS